MNRLVAVVTILLVVGCARVPVTTHGNESLERHPPQHGRVTIDADKLERFDGMRRVIFTGNVVARHPTWRATADRMTVQFDDTGQRIVSTTSIGDVRITTSDCRIGMAAQAEYRSLDQRVVLSGNVWIQSSDKRVVAGEAVRIYLPRTGFVGDCAPPERPRRHRDLIVGTPTVIVEHPTRR